MSLIGIVLALGLAVAQAREPAVSQGFQTHMVKLLTEAESRCTVAGQGWGQAQRRVREGLGRSLGRDLPRRWPPMDARVEGFTAFRGYKIEQVTAEFWPGVRNPMQVFVPDGSGPFPAVVMACAGAGARNQLYHGLGGALAGWESWSWGSSRSARGSRGRSTSTTGSPCSWARRSLRSSSTPARAALDYLLGRPDVDPKRIGMTGDSCGGWTTLYTSTMDPRITAAAPAFDQLYVLRLAAPEPVAHLRRRGREPPGGSSPMAPTSRS